MVSKKPGKNPVIKEKHPLAIRWFHWVNFPLLAIMIWSGMLIYWANDVYTLTLFSHKYFQFFPEPFYKALNISHRLAEGMAFHFLFMWFFALNGLLYVTYTLVSGEWRELLPTRHSFKEAWLVVLEDLHIRKKAPALRKYNAAQRIAYTGIVIMGFGSLVTGLAIYKPVQFYWLCWLCGGYTLARIEHFILTIGYVLFFVIHIVQVILAGWNNFRSVISGFEIVRQPAQTAAPTAAPLPAAPADSPGDLPKKIRRRNFLSFTTFFALGTIGWGGWRWLYKSADEQPGITAGTRKPLRKALNQSELFFRKLFSDKHPVATYPKSMAAKSVRVNSNIGSHGAVDISQWTLEILQNQGSMAAITTTAPLHITLDELKALPKTEIVYDFKCVEGWDQISWWGGVSFRDFVTHYGLEDQTRLGFVGMETPDKAYYIGIDSESALHPQTLLAYQVNGKDLPPEHGAPLRLIIPAKYGIKNIKRIGTISFGDRRPRDYWAEQGYDYYSGL